MTTVLTRRALTQRGALAAIAAVIVARDAAATPDQVKEWISSLSKGTPTEGKVTIKASEIAENGSAVPVTVTVDSEMSEKSWVKALHVAADGNPNPGVASYTFSALAGKVEVQLRVRMAQTQKLVAVAEMNDGSVFIASRDVKVTIGGCGG